MPRKSTISAAKPKVAKPKVKPPAKPTEFEDPSFLLFLRAHNIDPENPDNAARVEYAKDRQKWESEYSLLQYIEANGGLDLDPLSDEAIEFQAKYAAVSGSHPLDVLLRISRNPFCDTRDRISASKASLEYVMRKVPAALELRGKDGGAIKLDMEQLRGLSDKELTTLHALLAKASGKVS